MQMARLLLLATIWAPCQLLTLPVLPQPHTNAHIILRSVLRVGVPVAEGHENEHDSLAMARSTEHALRAFCALNGVVALRCAGLHTTVAWQLVAKARELRDMTRANGGAARPAAAERFTLLLPGLLNNTWRVIELPWKAVRGPATPALAAAASASAVERSARALGMRVDAIARVREVAASAARALRLLAADATEDGANPGGDDSGSDSGSGGGGRASPCALMIPGALLTPSPPHQDPVPPPPLVHALPLVAGRATRVSPSLGLQLRTAGSDLWHAAATACNAPASLTLACARAAHAAQFNPGADREGLRQARVSGRGEGGRSQGTFGACQCMEHVRKHAREWLSFAPLCEAALLPAPTPALAPAPTPAPTTKPAPTRGGDNGEWTQVLPGAAQAEAEAADIAGDGAERRCLRLQNMCIALRDDGDAHGSRWSIGPDHSATVAQTLRLMRAMRCGANAPLFDSGGAESSGVRYQVGHFGMPFVAVKASDKTDPAPAGGIEKGRASAVLPVLLWPPYHPNYGHFVLDVLPMLWRDATLCAALGRESAPLKLLVLIPPPDASPPARTPPLPHHHALLLRRLLLRKAARCSGRDASAVHGAADIQVDVEVLSHRAWASQRRCFAAVLSCCAGDGIATHPPEHPHFDAAAVRAVSSATAPATPSTLPQPPSPSPSPSSSQMAPAAAVLFVSRRSKRRILNEIELVRLCSRLPAAIRLGGCSLLELGAVSSAAEVAVHDAALRGARVLVGAFGAGLTNALFLGTPAVAPAVVDTCTGISPAATQIAVLEIVPYRFEEDCSEWSEFYRTRFQGRVSHWARILTTNASQSSISCSYLPRRLLPQRSGRAPPVACAGEQWLARIPRGSVNCHVAADPERLALVLRDQDTVVDIGGFERALIAALGAIEIEKHESS